MCKAAVNFDGTEKGLSKKCASTVIDVITDNSNGFGSNEYRGTVMYMMNPDTFVQPGCWAPYCNHQMCIQFFYASCRPDVLRSAKKFRGTACGKTTPECKTNNGTSKLSSFSGQEVGCFCMNTSDCYSYDNN